MSNYELYFNLYPLKAGWQQLPELHLEYSPQNELEKREDVQQIELVNLVKRWLPKMVFIHVSTDYLFPLCLSLKKKNRKRNF
jgi:trafficking protein particle complex subunit 11